MRNIRDIAAIAALSLLLAGTSLHADDDLPYFATIAIERAPGASSLFGERIVSTLHVNEREKATTALAGIDGVDIISAHDDRVRITFIERPTVAGDADARFLQSSWVVDFEEDIVINLTNAVRAELEAPPTIAELERYVYDFIANKSYTRAFDLASQVAATGEGDCTEHAVLLAALARAAGHPARIVLGNIIIDSEAGLHAFGHAWTEIHDGTNWTIRDATLPGEDPSVRQLRYLPMAVLGDEGPGYFLSLVNTVASMPVRISGVGNPP